MVSREQAIRVIPGGLDSHETKDGFSDLVIEHRERARKLAKTLLRRWNVYLPRDEFESVVDYSLCQAARRFRPAKGASFMTFLFYHLRGNLLKYVREATKNSSMYCSIEDKFKNEIGESARLLVDGSRALFDEEQSILGGIVPSPEERYLSRERSQAFLNCCSGLTELEEDVIYRIYYKEEQIIAIAATLGYSRAHISRVKRSALKKLRQVFIEQREELGISPEKHDATTVRLSALRRKRSAPVAIEQPEEEEELKRAVA